MYCNAAPTCPPPPLQVFTSITPAWNNENLNRLATKLESGVIFAHVRAAYPGMPVSEQNCHPFQWGGCDHWLQLIACMVPTVWLALVIRASLVYSFMNARPRGACSATCVRGRLVVEWEAGSGRWQAGRWVAADQQGSA